MSWEEEIDKMNEEASKIIEKKIFELNKKEIKSYEEFKKGLEKLSQEFDNNDSDY